MNPDDLYMHAGIKLSIIQNLLNRHETKVVIICILVLLIKYMSWRKTLQKMQHSNFVIFKI
jgi:hypothetical protein